MRSFSVTLMALVALMVQASYCESGFMSCELLVASIVHAVCGRLAVLCGCMWFIGKPAVSCGCGLLVNQQCHVGVVYW